MNEAAFWKLVDQSGDCWEWRGRRDEQGYGFASRKRAHRAAWEFANGRIRAGLCVCHRCDNPKCVRPDHLFLGSRAVNNADMRQKGRQARGSRVPQAKLTERRVRELRVLKQEGWSSTDLARWFGVSGTTVCHVLQGKVWGWVE